MSHHATTPDAARWLMNAIRNITSGTDARVKAAFATPAIVDALAMISHHAATPEVMRWISTFVPTPGAVVTTGESAKTTFSPLATAIASECLFIAMDASLFTFYCDVATVTVADIRAFVIQQRDKRLANVPVNLQVDCKMLTPDNARMLLRNRTVVLIPT